MSLDLSDEVGQIAAGVGRLPGIDRSERSIELGVQGALQALGEVEAVDQADQVADLSGCSLDHHLEAARGDIGRIGLIAGRAGHRRGANRERTP